MLAYSGVHFITQPRFTFPPTLFHHSFSSLEPLAKRTTHMETPVSLSFFVDTSAIITSNNYVYVL